VKDASTLRRHLERYHQPAYYKWCKTENFLSMLPKDTKARKLKAEVAKKRQLTLDGQLVPRPPATKKLIYTHERFAEAAVRWMIATDQSLSALANEYFIVMIDTAALATNGVEIPGRHASRATVMRLFKENLWRLKALFNVCVF
ncbi:hypothetical protein R3P38DRAFT_2573848, partial [Favolaschia claudopus]